MIVRAAELADVNECMTLDHSYLTDHVWQMVVDERDLETRVTFRRVRLPRRMRVTYPHDLDLLVEHWQEETAGFLVAEEGGVVRGYADLIGQAWNQMAWLRNLAVDRTYRRRGVGTRLVQAGLQWTQHQGLQGLMAEAQTKNYPAIRFFEKLGFAFCGFNDQYYANQDIAIFFIKGTGGSAVQR
jgi:ribosomal protein S18 acetylase RimI-like enzyme